MVGDTGCDAVGLKIKGKSVGLLSFITQHTSNKTTQV